MRSSFVGRAGLASLSFIAALPFTACSGDGETTAGDGLAARGGETTTPEMLSPAPARPPAPAAGSPCAADPEGVTVLERPMFPDREGSPTFGYSYKLYPGTDPNAATVIYVPGGPGQPGIDVERDPDYAPLEYPHIQTDLRGIGCNAPETVEHYPDEFYRSEFFADDVIAIVEDLGLDNYVLYGISYGTALATMVASRIEARGLPPPRALVLEGVLGGAFTSDLPGTEAAFVERWRLVRDSLDESIRSQLVAEPLPLDLTPEQWGAGITGGLGVAEFPGFTDPGYLGLMLGNLAPGLSEEERNSLRDVILDAGASTVDVMGDRLHHLVSCHEFSETEYVSLKLEAGELVPTRFDCTEVALSEPFSAADWPVHVPIYYFSGTLDPNTPPWQASAHFNAQTAAPRQVVHVLGGGHNARIFNLGDCAGPLWQTMTGGGDLTAAVATCSWPHALQGAPPVAAAP